MPQVDDPEQEHVAPSDAARDALHKFAELRAYAQHFAAAKVDLAKFTAKKIAILAALGIIGVLVLCTTVVIALVMLLSGLAGAIGSGLGGRMWAGNLIVGGIVVGAVGASAFAGLGMLKRSSMKSTVKKYELAEQQQRDSFGRTSGDRTAAAGKVEV